MTLVEVMEHTAAVFEVLGAVTLVAGTVLAMALAIRVLVRSGGGRPAYLTLRETFGGALLLSIEILVAADLLRTVAVVPSVSDVAVLGLIVLIRTFLSFSLEIELEGVAPWRRAMVTGVGHLAAATARARERSAPPRS
ncbi:MULTISPECIES: DUF1622 domain-containing protein [unclassified Pseudonocardia]|uniref:DUF1622 domain-containing protein n=1 Tax=unclassified Pseudonocardia TaxID=2619320 RepID=UPI0025E0FE80|nr:MULTISPECIES: DUF1622 domain-containing protein [unclassified Pseudonocardia]